MRLPRRRRRQTRDPRAAWMATAAAYADRMTETGSHCHLNDGRSRFCQWRAQELPSTTAEGVPGVGVRCTIHPGGRYLDASARLSPRAFTPTRDERAGD